MNTSLTFDDKNFRPELAWVPTSHQRSERFVTFWDNYTTKTYDFLLYRQPTIAQNTGIGPKHWTNIVGESERKISPSLDIIAIVAQRSYYDSRVGSGIAGYGSLIFVAIDKSIKYCYIGVPLDLTLV